MFDDEVHSFRPDAVFTYGGLEDDQRRYARARRQGAKVVFGLRNMGYMQGAGFLHGMDGILTPSQFLTNLYRCAAGLESTALPDSIEIEDVVAPERDPIFVTVVNPSPEKGLMIVARMAEELSLRRPDIPMLIVESRGSAGKLVQAGMLGGFDLRRHENLMMSPPIALPRDIFLPAWCLLVPSTIPEAAGRVAAEALLNGVPPLVNARGGLPETCNGAGFSFPIPGEIGPDFPVPVPEEIVDPWIETIVRLEADPEFFREQSDRAREAGKAYLPENLAPRYIEYFREVLDK